MARFLKCEAGNRDCQLRGGRAGPPTIALPSGAGRSCRYDCSALDAQASTAQPGQACLDCHTLHR